MSLFSDHPPVYYQEYVGNERRSTTSCLCYKFDLDSIYWFGFDRMTSIHPQQHYIYAQHLISPLFSSRMIRTSISGWQRSPCNETCVTIEYGNKCIASKHRTMKFPSRLSRILIRIGNEFSIMYYSFNEMFHICAVQSTIQIVWITHPFPKLIPIQLNCGIMSWFRFYEMVWPQKNSFYSRWVS